MISHRDAGNKRKQGSERRISPSNFEGNARERAARAVLARLVRDRKEQR